MTGAINIQFLQDGGVPLTNDLMAEIMSAISLYNVLGELAGNLTIISGCVVTGNTVSNGVVYINGDILPFSGGYISETVIVEETTIEKTFENLQDKGLVFKKVAKFGIGNPEYPWTDFKNIKSLKQLAADLESKAEKSIVDQLVQEVNILKLKTAPIINGGIVWAFRKPVAEIPDGWKECLDIRGKTIVGWNPNEQEFNTLNSDFGEKSTTLNISQLPTNNVSIVVKDPYSGNQSAGGFDGSNKNIWKDRTIQINVGGSGQYHNNVQPSRIALYIEPNFK